MTSQLLPVTRWSNYFLTFATSQTLDNIQLTGVYK